MSVVLQQLKTRVGGRRVGVIGIGVSNTPVIRLLASLGAQVVARDKNPQAVSAELAAQFAALGVQTMLGDGYLDGLDEQLILRTPGLRYDVPELAAARSAGAEVTSEMELFFELCPCPIFGVTGSDGKTTTTTLICEMLSRQGFICHKGGNIGTPLLPVIDRISRSDIAVVELSSFQLQDMRRSPDVAVITNLSPNHLDYHIDFEEYIEAKSAIFRFQTPNDRLVYNADDPVSARLVAQAHGEKTAFSRQRCTGRSVYRHEDRIFYADDHHEPQAILRVRDIRLPGEHNVENYMAAAAAVMDYVDPENIAAVAREFGGVEHRIEFVRQVAGVSYYNDSIASSPTRAAAGLKSFEDRLILIAGGYDKHLDYTEFGALVCERVKQLILIGDTAQKIYNAVTGCPAYAEEMIKISRCDSLEQAVSQAAAAARKGDVVLLSPASASFDMFKNFMERGEAFKDLVKAL